MSKALDEVKELINKGKFLEGEKKLFCNWLIAEIDFDCKNCLNNIDDK